MRGFELAKDAGFAQDRATLLGSLFVGIVMALVVMWPANRVVVFIFKWFNRGFTATSNGYARLIGGFLHRFGRVLLVYGGLLAITAYLYSGLPPSVRDSLHQAGRYAHDRGWSESDDIFAKPGWVKQLVEFPGHAPRLHPVAGHGLPADQHPAPRLGLGGADQAVIDRINDIGHEIPGVNATVGICRPVDPAQRLRVELRHDVRHAPGVRQAEDATTSITRRSPTSCGPGSARRSPKRLS